MRSIQLTRQNRTRSLFPGGAHEDGGGHPNAPTLRPNKRPSGITTAHLDRLHMVGHGKHHGLSCRLAHAHSSCMLRHCFCFSPEGTTLSQLRASAAAQPPSVALGYATRTWSVEMDGIHWCARRRDRNRARFVSVSAHRRRVGTHQRSTDHSGVMQCKGGTAFAELMPFALSWHRTVPSARKSPERNWDGYKWTLLSQAEHSTPDPSVREPEFYVDNESGGRPVAPDTKTGRAWSLSELKPLIESWCSGQDRSNSFVPIILRQTGSNSW